MEFRQTKSPTYSVGFEPLQVEEDDDDEEEYEDFEELDVLTSSSSQIQNHRRHHLKESSRSCSEVDDDEQDVSSEEDEEDSSGCSEEESETSEISTVDSQAPKDASLSQCSSSSVIFKESSASVDKPEDVSTVKKSREKMSMSDSNPNSMHTTAVDSSPKHNFGLQKMPSYEFKFSTEGMVQGVTNSTAMGKSGTDGDQAPSTSSSGSKTNLTTSADSTSVSTVSANRGTSSLFEESSKANKTCQSPSLSTRATTLSASTSCAAPTPMNIGCGSNTTSTNALSPASLGGSNDFNSLSSFPSLLTDGSQNKLAKSNNKTSASASGGTALFTGLGAKIPVISPSATAALEKHLKSLSDERNNSSSVSGCGVVPVSTASHSTIGAVTSTDDVDSDNVITNNNNNNGNKRNSRNMDGINFLSCPSSAALPPTPPTAPGSSGSHHYGGTSSSSSNSKDLFASANQPVKPARVSLPTKSSKQGRLKSPSRRKSNVSSPPPTVDDMLLGSGGGSSSCSHAGGGGYNSSGKSGKKKLTAKRYASSLPDRERCSATSPVAFDLNSYLCHTQGPIDFSSLLSRVHQQQQYLHQQQLSHHPSSHMIHHPQPTIPFMGHPKPTKHCKNKHMWARASLERDIITGNGGASSPTPMSAGNACNNLSGGGSNSAMASGHSFTDKPVCSSKLNSGIGVPPPNPSNRHSSYHPNYSLGPGATIVGDSAAAAAAAAAAAYNAHLLFSRPTSPLFLADSASCCGSDYGAYCPGCSAKTFPRVARTGAHHGLCFCCHQNSTNSTSQQSTSRAQSSTPGGCADGSVVGGGGGGSLLGLDYEDRLLRLESDKDTLHLQVSVLSDQIEAQTAKIHDLEKMLDDKRNVLESTEDQLQRELLLRSSLETQKLELMTEISSLRLKHASLERENIELKDRVVGKSTGDLSYIDSSSTAGLGGGGSSRVWEKPPIGPERAASPAHSISVDPSVAARSRLGSAASEHHHAPPQRTRTPPANAYRRVDQSAFGTIPRRSPHSSQLSANNSTAFNGNLLGGQLGGGGSAMDPHGKSHGNKANSLSSGNIHAITHFNNGLLHLRQQQQNISSTLHQQQQLLIRQQQQLLLAQNQMQTFSPSVVPGEFDDDDDDNVYSDEHNNLKHESTGGGGGGSDSIMANNNEESNNDSTIAFNSSPSPPPPPTSQPVVSHRVDSPPPSSSNPYEASSSSPSTSKNRSSTSGAWAYRKARRVVAPLTTLPSGIVGAGGGIVSSISRVFNPRSSCRSTSTPNLVSISDNKEPGDQWGRKPGGDVESNNSNANKSKQSPSGGSNSSHKSRGILRILGKLKRSNSGGLDNDVAPMENTTGGPFVRGGVRATAHPRLGWMKDPSPIIKKPDGPVNSWDSEAVITWLNYLGLGSYAGEVKRWVKSGQQLLDASNHELEKELGIKNTLHRKKLSLALGALRHPEEEDNAGKLDYHWVIRWLDDVGLPQYKEQFMEARIDGRVLGHLTAEDLVSLKVTSVLHHASIKRGIQLLRIHKFHPDCLCRRGGPNPGSVSNGGGTTGGTLLGNNSNGSNGTNGEHCSTTLPSGSVWGPKHVATWTNHRVMEWLKAIDLAEYAPNLRGSGVHGALIIFEPRFNSELMGTLLAIPGNKTLLRRHLSLQFNELVGRHIVQEKRVAETASDFVPLNPTTKVKLPKKSQFPLRKKRLSTEMAEDLLCPQDLNTYPFNADSSSQITTSGATVAVVVGSNEMAVDGTKAEEKVSDI